MAFNKAASLVPGDRELVFDQMIQFPGVIALIDHVFPLNTGAAS
jgi:hypothetical protein